MGTGYDGHITLKTKVDTSGIKSDLDALKTKETSTSSAFSKLNSEIAEQESKFQNCKRATSKLNTGLTSLASTIAGTFSVYAIANFSKESSNMATTTESSVLRLVDIYGKASKSVGDFIDSNADALGMSKASATQFSSVYGNLFSVWADQATNAELTNQYLNATAVVASKTGRTVEDVQERIRSGLLGNTEAIEDLGIFVNVKTIEMTKAFKRMANGKSWEQLDAYTQQQIRTMAILEQATEKYGTEVANTNALTKAQNQAAYEDFQNTWGQLVNTVLMPILKVGTQILKVFTQGMQAIAGLSGKTITQNKVQASSIQDSVDNQNALTAAVKETAAAQEKATAGFDNLNVLSGQAANTASATSSGLDDLGLEEMNVTSGGQANEVDSVLSTILGVVGGALAAVGVLLLLSGFIGWGIGFIIAGAAILGVTAAAVVDSDLDPSDKLSSIIGIVAGLVLALGIILLLKGPVTAKPLAMGMIIAGAGILAVSAAQLAANKIGGEVGTVMHGIIAIVSAALLAIGIIMVCTGNVTPLSIGLIATGAVGLVSELAVNYDEVSESLEGWLGVILALISSALIVIGIIMVCTGNVSPLSIGLIVAGAVGLASTVAINFDTIIEAIRGPIGVIMAILGASLIVLGIILLCCGVIPLGIGLLVAGAVSLATPIAANWDFLTKSVKKICSAIGGFFSDMWGNITQGFKDGVNFCIDFINGIIGGFESFVNLIISGINTLIDGINKIKIDIPDWLGGGTLGFNIKKIDKVSYSGIPKLAKGAVIPANREFLAVLGDQKHGRNLEAPEDLIRQIVREESGGKNFTVQATGSMAQLIRLLRLEIQEENTRATIY